MPDHTQGKVAAYQHALVTVCWRNHRPGISLITSTALTSRAKSVAFFFFFFFVLEPKRQAVESKCLFQHVLSEQSFFGVCTISKNKQRKSYGPLLASEQFF